MELPNARKAQFLATWSALHNNASTTGIVGAWLEISYRFGLICTLLRITPNVLTLLGLLSALATAFTATSWWAISFLLASLFFDGIDGSVAIYQKRQSELGVLLDSIAHRISEALWLFALYRIGVPAWLAITLWSVAAIQEYARARLASLGVRDLGVITPAERPVRASFLVLALVAWHISIPGVIILGYIFLLVEIYSFILVMRYARAQLR